MNKTAIYIMIIIFLLVTNAATIIATLSMDDQKQEEDVPAPVIDLPRDNRIGFFHNQIGISDQQRRIFRQYNREFNQKAGELSAQMRDLRQYMVDEMASERPDTALLNSIASQFGSLHEKMKKLTMEYYFNLKSVSNEQQKERLHFMFRDMLDPEGRIYGRGRGGQGRRMGRGGNRTDMINQ